MYDRHLYFPLSDFKTPYPIPIRAPLCFLEREKRYSESKRKRCWQSPDVETLSYWVKSPKDVFTKTAASEKKREKKTTISLNKKVAAFGCFKSVKLQPNIFRKSHIISHGLRGIPVRLFSVHVVRLYNVTWQASRCIPVVILNRGVFPKRTCLFCPFTDDFILS